MHKLNIFPPRYKGHLGFKLIIWSNEMILIGKRSFNVDYMPGFLTVPGGIFEVNDINKSMITALRRELLEETGFRDIRSADVVLKAIGKQNKNYGMNLVFETHCNQLTEVIQNNEWMDGSLKFRSIEDVCRFDQTDCLEELNYLKERICH